MPTTFKVNAEVLNGFAAAHVAKHDAEALEQVCLPFCNTKCKFFSNV